MAKKKNNNNQRNNSGAPKPQPPARPAPSTPEPAISVAPSPAALAGFAPVAPAASFTPETQSQRRLKYGANVVLTGVIVVVLAGFLTYIAQRKNWRSDTTAGGDYSLKPQTVAVLDSLESRMRLQKAQQIVDVELPKIVTQLSALTDPTPPATAPAGPTTLPTLKLTPAAGMLRDRLVMAKVTAGDAIRGPRPDGAKIADQLRRDLDDAAAQANQTQRSSSDQSKAAPLGDAARTVQGWAQQLKDFRPQMRVVGLFTKARNDENQKVVEDVEAKPEVRYQQVADLLAEYQQKSGGRVSVEMIDPTNEPERLDKLFREVQEKYGNDVKKYRDALDEYSNTVTEIGQTIKQQDAAVKALLPKVKDERLSDFLDQVSGTFGTFGTGLKQVEEKVKEELGLRVPNYPGATSAVETWLTIVQANSAAVTREFGRVGADAAATAEVKQYVKDATPRFESIKASADKLLAKIRALPELKQFDELRQNKTNAIAVMGEYDVKSIPVESIYQVDENFRGEGKVRPRFAGEQQVSAAIVTLSSPGKKKVAFVRSGGSPLTARTRGGLPPFYALAQRLRDLDVDVVEKDVSGQWAAQAAQMQMQSRMPTPPEASDEELRDAAWIVPVIPQDPQQMMMNPAGALGPKIKAHLDAGGSAMIMCFPQTERMDFLKDWGIEARTDFVIVHDKIEQQGARSDDPAMDWWRQQFVFITKDYGDHLVTNALRSLDGLFYFLVPVATSTPKDGGVKVTPLLPIPNTPRSWGETDVDAVVRDQKEVQFAATKGNGKDQQPNDLSPPLWAGAAAENAAKGQRILVFGSLEFGTNQWAQMADQEVQRSTGRLVPRFPANAELFVNSAYWLLKMDPMIAISPAAMQISRIDPQMTDDRRTIWRTLIVGLLPIAVLAAGAFVYLKRRD